VNGAWRYRATAGVLRVPGAVQSPPFVQATLAHGMRHELTLYGGATAAPIYQAAVLGVARNMAVIGALSLDLTHARARLPDAHAESGQSVRLTYDKSLDALGTQFRVAGYRYSTRGYHTLSDLVQPGGADPFVLSAAGARERLQTNVSQSLGQAGSLYATFTQQGYWNQPGRDRVLQLGYTGSYKRIPYGINLSDERRADGTSRRQISFNVALPLGKAGDTAQYATASLISGSDGLREGTGINGTLREDHQLSYSLQADHSRSGGMSGSANAGYRSSVGEIGITQTQARDHAQTSIEAAGGLVVHAHGVTFSQPLGETIVLVAAPGADHVGIEAAPGVHTNRAGYAVVPSLTPYRRNRITLHTADLGRQVEVRTATRLVTPKRGAVVLAPFEVSIGRLMLDIKDAAGKPVPFGARVFTSAGREVGMVGPDGQSFITGAGNRGTLRVRWGKRPADQCNVSFDVTGSAKEAAYPEADVVCRPPQASSAAQTTAKAGPAAATQSTGNPS
jgi:outer membrane usher protein